MTISRGNQSDIRAQTVRQLSMDGPKDKYVSHLILSQHPTQPLQGVIFFDWLVFEIILNSIFSFMCMFCRSLLVFLYFFPWLLCCLFFFDLRILIIPLVPSNSSYELLLLDPQFSVQCFIDHGLSFCFISCCHCIVCPSSIYGF